MKAIKVLIMILCMLQWSCAGRTVYVERNSEALSRSVVATQRAIKKGRIELAEKYADEAAKIVDTPKEEVVIESVVKENKRLLVVPAALADFTKISVDSKEWEDLQKDKTIKTQLEKDNQHLTAQIKDNVEQRKKNTGVRAALVADLNRMTTELAEKDGRIFKLYTTITGMFLVFGAMIWLRIKGVL